MLIFYTRNRRLLGPPKTGDPSFPRQQRRQWMSAGGRVRRLPNGTQHQRVELEAIERIVGEALTRSGLGRIQARMGGEA
jgi:hypothetical protein